MKLQNADRKCYARPTYCSVRLPPKTPTWSLEFVNSEEQLHNIYSTFQSSADGSLSFHSLPIVRPVPGQRTPPIRTQARAATILPNFVGLKFQVHNGKNYIDITVTEDMVGHKLGEFSP